MAHVTVKRGNLNDTLLLRATGLKPNLQFDMFTVQRSPLDANGKPVANFKGFGMACTRVTSKLMRMARLRS